MGEVRRDGGILCQMAFELDQPAKVAASEGYEGYGVPMAVDR